MASMFNIYEDLLPPPGWASEKLPPKIEPEIVDTKEVTDFLYAYYEFISSGSLDGVKSISICDSTITSVLTSPDLGKQRILVDGEFLLAIEKVTKSELIKSIRNHFITQLINAKIKKREIQEYLINLYKVQTKGECSKQLLSQLAKLELVPFRANFNETLLVAWHIAVFVLTFKHDIDVIRPGYGV